MEGKKILIKKYENRRLYDTAGSRYVNLDEVAAMIRDGADVQVVDARTGEDLTRLILTQIIVEHAKEREFALPLDILRQLVVASGRAGQEGFANYWKTASNMYQNAYRAFGAPVNPLDLMRTLGGGIFGAPPPAAEQEPPPPDTQAPGDPAELAELRRRVEELERRLTRKRRTPKKRANS